VPRPARKIQGLLFDFGNVISRVDYRRFLASLARLCDGPPSRLQDLALGHSALQVAYETGAITSAQFLDQIRLLCGAPLPEAAFLEAFTDIFEPIRENIDLIRLLKPHYRLGLISNTNPWHFEYAIRPSEVYPLFESVTLSCEVGAMKPDRRLFDDALGKLALEPEDCVFIDDLRPFVEAARALGMRGVTCTTPAALRAGLRRLGVLQVQGRTAPLNSQQVGNRRY
jgi:putative hydrolase of the HAD superfamily